MWLGVRSIDYTNNGIFPIFVFDFYENRFNNMGYEHTDIFADAIVFYGSYILNKQSIPDRLSGHFDDNV